MSENFPPIWDFLNDGFWSIQLDIVGFLAILGEASVLSNGQVAHMSRTCMLPRLIPAPQALIRTSRPERLEASTGVVVGAHSGNIRRHVNHIPQVLHQVAFHNYRRRTSEPGEYHTRAIEIRWAKNLPNRERNITFATKRAADRSKFGSPRAPRARTRSWGPVIFLAWIGCLQALALLIWSIIRKDGMSLLAVLLISTCSSLVGMASYWTLELPTRTEMRDDIPPSDVIISYPNGSFLIVRCPEDIARLYFQTEKCRYLIKSQWQYRSISLVASILLMIGVICLANASPLLQLLWAIMYITLNAAYWIVAALPSRWHWDMSSFETGWETYQWTKYNKSKDEKGVVRFATEQLSGNDIGRNATFTEALWRAIALTKNSRWARIGEIAPDTPGWDRWLRQAVRASAGLPAESYEEHRLDEQEELKKAEPDVRPPKMDQKEDIKPTEEEADNEAKKEKHGKITASHDHDEKNPVQQINETEKTSSPNSRSSSNIDPETLTDKVGNIRVGSQEIPSLPVWNYNEALTKCLKQRKRDSWV